jgi:hypothetical protein
MQVAMKELKKRLVLKFKSNQQDKENLSALDKVKGLEV